MMRAGGSAPPVPPHQGHSPWTHLPDRSIERNKQFPGGGIRLRLFPRRLLPRAGGMLPPAGCKASGKTKKRRRESKLSLRRFLRFLFARGNAYSFPKVSHALKMIVRSISNIVYAGPGVATPGAGYRGRGGPCSWSALKKSPRFRGSPFMQGISRFPAVRYSCSA